MGQAGRQRELLARLSDENDLTDKINLFFLATYPNL